MSTEEWKTLEPEFPNRFVSSLGRFRHGDNILKAAPRKTGYIVMPLIDEHGKKRSKSATRMVALAFIPNPENKPHVDHINRKRDDNRVENLRWVTVVENSANRDTSNYKGVRKKVIQMDLEGTVIKVWESLISAARTLSLHPNYIRWVCIGQMEQTGNYKWKFEDPAPEPPGVEWRTLVVDGKTLKISSDGRIKTERGLITYGSRGRDGYHRMAFHRKSFSVHRLVAEAFHPIRPSTHTHVNHVDGSPSNNCASNLEWVTRSENAQHASRTGLLKPKKRKVDQIDDGKVVATFDSIKEAGLAVNAFPNNILMVCKRRRGTCKGFGWRYNNIEDGEYQKAGVKTDSSATTDQRRLLSSAS
jgi:hypothetical protein